MAQSPPLGLHLTGSDIEGEAGKYLGLYKLVPGQEVHGKPVWRHTSRADRCIAFTGSFWMAQHMRFLGERKGWLQLIDRECPTPDCSRVVWKSSDGKGGWTSQPYLSCRALGPAEMPPPESLKLDGAPLTGAVCSCLGVYKLAAGRLVNGRPCWRHSRRSDYWLAWSGSAWVAQHSRDLSERKGCAL